jgi:DnaJ like chaperone protein
MWGKIAGGFFGYMLTAPVGLGFLGFLIGFSLGRQFDRSLSGTQHFSSFFRTSFGIREVFFECTFAVMGHIAKADGVVSRKEILVAQQFMRQLNMSEESKKLAKKAFSRGKQDDFALDQALLRLRQVCLFQPTLLQLFLEIQVQVASVEAGNIAKKKQILNYIMQVLGVGASHQGWSSGQRAYGGSAGGARMHRTTTVNEVDAAYKLLKVSAQDSDARVKRAYKKMMGEHHPDRLVAKGLPQEMIKVATQKAQQIKQAYDHIMSHRASVG